MNDNNQNFSNTPYKATGNLNTVIGNPNININSAVTSNIMEDNVDVPSSFSNNVNQSNFMDSNSGVVDNSFSNSNLNSPILTMENSNLGINNDDNIIEEDPIQSFIKKSNNVSSFSNQNSMMSQVEPEVNIENTNSSNYVSNVNTNMDSNIITNININTNTDTIKSNQNNDVSQVRYENAYQTNQKNRPKKSVKIPSEFKTAVFVALILLIGIYCFDPIYDFFRNLNIFG